MAGPAGASIRERYKSTNSLLCLLQGITDRVTTVELRNESTAKGCIQNVDGFMNITMTNVVFTSRDGTTSRLDEFFVKGPQIRYVQIPDDVDMMRVMREQVRMPGQGMRMGRGGGRGRGRGGGFASSSGRLPQPD